jgi:hypothetical protein
MGNDAVAKWTFIVYLDADNNLEGPGVEDLNEMETAGSTADVNFVVQFDRIPEYDTSNGDWTSTKRYYVTQDDDMSTINSIELKDLGELNMGDPNILADFVIWAVDNYPAEHYILVLWDHGGSFWGVCWDDTIDEDDNDEDTYDYLDMSNLSEALSKIKLHLGRNLDIVGFDACLMAEVSVLYQIKDYTDIVVASGYVEPGDGWPYELICKALADKPTMSPEQLATEIAEDYVRSYEIIKGYTSSAISMAAFDMELFDVAAEKVNRFAMYLASGGKDKFLIERKKDLYYGQVSLIRSQVESYSMANVGPFDFDGYCMYDIIGFATNISQSEYLSTIAGGVSAIPKDVEAAAETAKLALEASIIHAAIDKRHPNAHGLTIYFPNGIEESGLPGVNIYDDTYSYLAFGYDMFWDDFLRDYFAKIPRELAENTPPSCKVTIPDSNNITIPAEINSYVIEGLAFDVQTSPKVEIMINGKRELVPVDHDGSWRFQWDISKLSGTYMVSVHAIDREDSKLTSPTTELLIHIESKVMPKKQPEYSGWLIIGSICVVIILISVWYYFTYYRKMKK